jgi:ribose 5-phosphate isomerase B
MKIAVGSDEPYASDTVLVQELERRGHIVIPFGAAHTGTEHPWVAVARDAASCVPKRADEAILLCWSGTGVTMAANKLPGIRAALCADAQTATAARVWNHANVLCLAHRTLSVDMLKEILDAWFAPYDRAQGLSGVAHLDALDRESRTC